MDGQRRKPPGWRRALGPAEGTGAGLAAEPEEVGELVAAHGTAGRGPHRMWGTSAARALARGRPMRAERGAAAERRRRATSSSWCRPWRAPQCRGFVRAVSCVHYGLPQFWWVRWFAPAVRYWVVSPSCCIWLFRYPE